MGRLIVVLLVCACLMTLASAQCSVYNTCFDCTNQTLTQTTCQWCTNDNGTPGYCNLLSNHTTCPTFSAYSTLSSCPVATATDYAIGAAILAVEIVVPIFVCLLSIILRVYVVLRRRRSGNTGVVESQPSSNIVLQNNRGYSPQEDYPPQAPPAYPEKDVK